MYKQGCLILSEGCNFNCPFCFEGGRKNLANKMSDETFDKILQKLKQEKANRLVLMGGEPLTNFTPHMQESLLKDKDYFQVAIYTNGSLLTNELVDYFLKFPDVRINISCHNDLSIKGAELVAKKAKPYQYYLFVVGDHLTFKDKFLKIKHLVDNYGAIFVPQLVVPDFNYSPEYTLPLYDLLYPYRKQIQEYDLFQDTSNEVRDGSDQPTELIFTYDGRISLTASVGIKETDKVFPLDTSFREIIESDANPNNTPIEHFPWQCEKCPIKNYKKANCPRAWGEGHDYTLCRRQIFLYSVIKGERNLLCDEIMAQQPMPKSYDEFNNKIMNIMLNVTDQCNFRCRMCFCNWEEHYMTEEIADRGIELALSRLSPLTDKLTINFFGGEPLMNFSLIKYVVNKWKDKCDFSITTNGSLLDEEKVKFLKDNNIGLLFSIDGDKETQDYNRPFASGKGSTFDVLEKKIPMILENWPVVTFRSTVIPETVHLLHHNYTFAKEKGFKNYFCTPDAYSDWSSKAGELKKQVALITADIIKDIYEGSMPLIPKFFTDGIMDFLRIRDGLTTPSNSPFRCGMGVYGFGIGATGIVSACQEHSTITDNPDDIFIIGDVWNGIDKDRHWKLLDKFYQEKSKWIMNECKDCTLREICVNHVCPSRQGFMFGRFDQHALADCLWTQCCYMAGDMAVTFFEKFYSPNFESFLKELLNREQLEMKKEVTYEV